MRQRHTSEKGKAFGIMAIVLFALVMGLGGFITLYDLVVNAPGSSELFKFVWALSVWTAFWAIIATVGGAICYRFKGEETWADAFERCLKGNNHVFFFFLGLSVLTTIYALFHFGEPLLWGSIKGVPGVLGESVWGRFTSIFNDIVTNTKDPGSVFYAAADPPTHWYDFLFPTRTNSWIFWHMTAGLYFITFVCGLFSFWDDLLHAVQVFWKVVSRLVQGAREVHHQMALDAAIKSSGNRKGGKGGAPVVVQQNHSFWDLLTVDIIANALVEGFEAFTTRRRERA